MEEIEENTERVTVSIKEAQNNNKQGSQGSEIGKIQTAKDDSSSILENIPVGDIEAHAHMIATKTTNSYAAKKTVAQGMMDIALITSNANQLRYLVEYASDSRSYYLNLVLIIVSLWLQVAVGICLLAKGRYEMMGRKKSKIVAKINNFSVIGVFLITLINVFIASFTMTGKKQKSSSRHHFVGFAPVPENMTTNSVEI